MIAVYFCKLKMRKRAETDTARLFVKMDFREVYKAELRPGRHRF